MAHKGFQEYGNAFSYFFGRIAQNGIIRRANSVMKRARWGLLISRIIARVIKYASFIIAFIETSAVTVVIAATLIVTVPIAAVTMAFISLLSLYTVRKERAGIEKMFEGDSKIMFIFAERGFGGKRSAFTEGMARDFAKNGFNVFVVSRPVLKDCVTAQKIDENLWVLKLNSFYIIRRKYLKKADPSKLIFIS